MTRSFIREYFLALLFISLLSFTALFAPHWEPQAIASCPTELC